MRPRKFDPISPRRQRSFAIGLFTLYGSSCTGCTLSKRTTSQISHELASGIIVTNLLLAERRIVANPIETDCLKNNTCVEKLNAGVTF